MRNIIYVDVSNLATTNCTKIVSSKMNWGVLFVLMLIIYSCSSEWMLNSLNIISSSCHLEVRSALFYWCICSGFIQDNIGSTIWAGSIVEYAGYRRKGWWACENSSFWGITSYVDLFGCCSCWFVWLCGGYITRWYDQFIYQPVAIPLAILIDS